MEVGKPDYGLLCFRWRVRWYLGQLKVVQVFLLIFTALVIIIVYKRGLHKPPVMANHTASTKAARARRGREH